MLRFHNKYSRTVFFVLAGLVLALSIAQTTILTNQAQASEAVTASDTAAVQGTATHQEPAPSTWQVLRTGGFVMLILVLLSVATIALIIYYALTLRTQAVIPPAFTTRLDDILSRSRFDEAKMFCTQQGAPFARIIESGINAAPRGHEMIHEAISSEGARQSSSLWQRISYLNDIAIVAPMLGLLGTVIGMLDSFLAISTTGGTTVGMINPSALANGVAKALITTVGGLIVGIIATIAYAYFRGTIQRLVVLMEAESTGFAETIEINRKRTP